MNVKDIFIGKANKYNHFQSSHGFYEKNQSCKTCIRKSFSFPYTCNYGWIKEKDLGSECINWTVDKTCKVD